MTKTTDRFFTLWVATMALILIAATLFAGYRNGQDTTTTQGCATDTECAEMHGGDGGPEVQE